MIRIFLETIEMMLTQGVYWYESMKIMIFNDIFEERHDFLDQMEEHLN
jgi:hypothetical protein